MPWNATPFNQAEPGSFVGVGAEAGRLIAPRALPYVARVIDPSLSPGCGVCASLSGPRPGEGASARVVLYEDDLWHVRHIDPPYPLAGWMLLITRRHVGGPAHFDDIEARAFGPALRHFERVLEEVTGALRIYTAAMGESHPHFHAHMVPRYATMPRDAKAWGAFDLQRAAAAGEIAPADPEEVARVSAAYRDALVRRPAPR
jgi:diadenosine tetraphosphate (Ap4A) HIT family hydrolase